MLVDLEQDFESLGFRVSAAPPESLSAMHVFLTRWIAEMKSPTEALKAGAALVVV